MIPNNAYLILVGKEIGKLQVLDQVAELENPGVLSIRIMPRGGQLLAADKSKYHITLHSPTSGTSSHRCDAKAAWISHGDEVDGDTVVKIVCQFGAGQKNRYAKGKDRADGPTTEGEVWRLRVAYTFPNGYTGEIALNERASNRIMLLAEGHEPIVRNRHKYLLVGRDSTGRAVGVHEDLPTLRVSKGSTLIIGLQTHEGTSLSNTECILKGGRLILPQSGPVYSSNNVNDCFRVYGMKYDRTAFHEYPVEYVTHSYDQMWTILTCKITHTHNRGDSLLGNVTIYVAYQPKYKFDDELANVKNGFQRKVILEEGEP